PPGSPLLRAPAEAHLPPVSRAHHPPRPRLRLPRLGRSLAGAPSFPNRARPARAAARTARATAVTLSPYNLQRRTHMLFERRRVYGREAIEFARRYRVPAELLTYEVHDDGSKVVDNIATIERAEELAAADPQLVWFEWPEAERF